MKTEWTEADDALFEAATLAIDEGMADEDLSFDGLIEHYSSLFGITEDALRHEWSLRNDIASDRRPIHQAYA